jgi:SAM-dependent methyltransferase
MAKAIEHDWDREYSSQRRPPWEIGKPQPAIASLLDQLDIADPVLDVGCGTGELAIYLAERGHQVVGIDASPTAIDKARSKAAGIRSKMTFLVADATRLTDLDIGPRTVFDSGLLHSLDDDGVQAYVSGLEVICDSGAFVCVLAMSAEGELGWGVTQAELIKTFAEPQWRGSKIRTVEITAGVDGEELHLPAFLLTTRRA